MAYSVNKSINNHHRGHDLKHFCKICKKGFGCGRALGGHMRAHGIGDESGLMEDDEDEEEDQASDWDDKMVAAGTTSNAHAHAPSPSNKRMYALRTNPNRLKTCRSCENCGKDFSSWKSFLEHGKCGGAAESDGEEEKSPTISSPQSDISRWSRRKSSLQANGGPSREEEDLAHCLMMLSNANAEPDHESCASANRDIDHLNSLMMMGSFSRASGMKAKSVAKGVFECKACKKVFNSHQALGGHRASHKKVKGCFAARLDENNIQNPLQGEAETLVTNYEHDQFTVPTPPKPALYALQLTTPNAQHFPSSTPSSSKRKSKVHECSICHRVFSSGQALGGHKRCHWITWNNLGQDTTLLSSSSKFPHFDQLTAANLDLNLPPFNDSHQVIQQRNALSFELSAENYFLQNNELKCNDEVTITNNNNNLSTKNNNNVVEQEEEEQVEEDEEEDDANSKMRLAKLSELKDVKEGGEGSSSSWLQVGLGLTTTDNVVVVGDENM